MAASSGSVQLFVGTLAERSPAQGAKTLFVVGGPPAHEIIRAAAEHRVAHVFIGANHARNERIERFHPPALDWVRLVGEFLNRQLGVTLEYPPERHGEVLELFARFFDRKGFIAQLVVPLPPAMPNASAFSVKLEQFFGKAHERGVWVWPASQLRADHRYTQYLDRPDDEIVRRSDSH